MLVLKIIGILAALFVTHLIIDYLNKYTDKKYNYEFIDWNSYFIVAISYVFIFIGEKAYSHAVESSGDILNGQLLIGIGIIGLITMLYLNIKNTNFLVGILGTLFQFAIYGVLAVVGLIALLLAGAFFSQTKPVYNLN